MGWTQFLRTQRNPNHRRSLLFFSVDLCVLSVKKVLPKPVQVIFREIGNFGVPAPQRRVSVPHRRQLSGASPYGTKTVLGPTTFTPLDSVCNFAETNPFSFTAPIVI